MLLCYQDSKKVTGHPVRSLGIRSVNAVMGVDPMEIRQSVDHAVVVPALHGSGAEFGNMGPIFLAGPQRWAPVAQQNKRGIPVLRLDAGNGLLNKKEAQAAIPCRISIQ
jgi:hypothetical protein